MTPPLPENIQVISRNLVQRYPHLEQASVTMEDVFGQMTEMFSRGGILYLCGNGGSFADAIHIKGELAKSFVRKRNLCDRELLQQLQITAKGVLLAEQLERGLPVVVLGESHSLRSAYANDKDPHLIYAQELYSFLGNLKEGLFLGISTSGNAQNIYNAMVLAQACKIPTIGFTGPDGGFLTQLADIAWRVPGGSTYEIQENQILLYHGLCLMIEEHFFPDCPA